MWNRQSSKSPEIRLIGEGGSTFLPAVIAFQRERGGHITILVGEKADELEDGPNTIVVRNLKRLLISSDPFVRWQLEGRGAPWPTWWNPEKRHLELWGKVFTATEVLTAILREALARAGVGKLALEWRAGCPVNSDFAFRKLLVQTLSGSSQPARIEWIVPEPLIVLALLHELRCLSEGAYLIYDFGGGSFDCSLASIEWREEGTHLTVYAADGHPLLGGMDIDERLRERLGYKDRPHLLRIAKEKVSPTNPRIDLPGGLQLTWDDVVTVLQEGRFFEKTIPVMMDVYKYAKLLWKRPKEAPPIGDILDWDPEDRTIYRTVWQLRIEDLAKDVDGVILFGGPTRSPYFIERLVEIFGQAKVKPIGKLLSAISDPELTAVGLGACYISPGKYVPLYLDRVPARIVLQVRVGAGKGTIEIAYEPFSRLPLHPPNAPYESDRLQLPWGEPATYEVKIEDPDGNTLYTMQSKEARLPREGFRGPFTNTLSLVIDRFGRVGVNMTTGKGRAESHTWVKVLENPPWQTTVQRQALERLWAAQRQFEEQQKLQLHEYLTLNPYGWQEHPG
jgi:hypothetical protein